MTHSQAEIVRQLLIDMGFGVASSYDAGKYNGLPWPVFATNEPFTPDSCITVYDTTGMVDGRDMEGEINEHLGVQVRVRSANQGPARAKIDAIRTALAGAALRDVAVDGSSYTIYCLSKFGSRLALGKEPTTNRSLFTINMLAAIRQL